MKVNKHNMRFLFIVMITFLYFTNVISYSYYNSNEGCTCYCGTRPPAPAPSRTIYRAPAIIYRAPGSGGAGGYGGGPGESGESGESGY
jgi:hypothetical protein